MIIQKRALLHFVILFSLYQSIMLADSARCFPRLFQPGMVKADRSSALPNISVSDINLCI